MKKNNDNLFSLDSADEFENDHGYDDETSYEDEYEEYSYDKGDSEEKYGDYADEWEDDNATRPKKMRKNSINDWD